MRSSEKLERGGRLCFVRLSRGELLILYTLLRSNLRDNEAKVDEKTNEAEN